MTTRLRPFPPAALAALLACATAQPPAPAAEEPVPTGRLPADVRPTHYRLSLDVSGAQLAGTEEIALQLAQPRRVLWLHARGLAVAGFLEQAGARIALVSSQVNEDGVAKLQLEREAAPGVALLRLAWTGPFDPQLVGVYKTRAAGRDYVFSKFEAISHALQRTSLLMAQRSFSPEPPTKAAPTWPFFSGKSVS